MSAVDLQAMDRAHRLGQDKIVNVYRYEIKSEQILLLLSAGDDLILFCSLISRDTIEDRIMR